MRTNAEDFRRQVIALGRRTRGARFPDALRAAIIGHARQRRQQGEGVRKIAQSVGVSPESIRRWTTSGAMPYRSKRRALVPIMVQREHDNVVVDSVIVSAPGGYRVEGLSVAAAADLLRRLA